MAYINFDIPANSSLLLSVSANKYSVKDVAIVKELPSELKNAKVALREEGAEFIIDAFDTYYSVLHHGDKVTMDLAYKAYEDLHKGVLELNKALGFILEDKESLNDEVRVKYLNILKMMLYVYTQTVLLIERRNSAKNEQLLRGRKKAKDKDDFTVDRKHMLLALNNIIQREISLFWEPPVVEENFVNMISGICYELLQNPSIKTEKEELYEIFNVIGYLLKVYNHGTSFVIRITQLVKLHEHLVQCLPKGIQQIVQNFNCKGLLHELIEELTQWQTDDKHQDNQGARHCASVLSALAALMPNLMIPEVMSLNNYLYHDPPSLRISVLTVMVEVILNNLTSHELNEEQREFRDELLEILIEHISDNSVFVRAKVLQQWARLQKESAIPLKFQGTVLEKVVDHLFDKGALARKSAANCVGTFLSYNAYSANLALSVKQKELDCKRKMLESVKEKFKDPKVEKLIELQTQWDSKIGKLKLFVEKELDKGKENDSGEPKRQNKHSLDQITEMIRVSLNENKLQEAFELCTSALQDANFLERFRENETSDDLVDIYLTIFHSIFFDMERLKNQDFVKITEEGYRELETLEREVEFLEQCVDFLKLIDSAIDKMVELLESTSITDMHEAIEFFVAAYQFNIDRAQIGILAMLKMMLRKEQERKDAVVNAFKIIYLQTDASNMTDHCIKIVKRLIELVKSVSINNIDDLQEIISDWCAKGVLDNGVIDMLWQYVTLRVSVPEKDVCASLEILRMAAIGRRTIISRNINLVTNIGFGDRGKKDMLLLGASCKLLSVAFESVDVNGKNEPFKIKPEDKCFKDLVDILVEQFFNPVEFYNKALSGAIEFVYKMCSKPETVCEDLLNRVLSNLSKKQKELSDANLPNYVMMRLCQVSGCVALKHLEYMDDTMYKELKRRHNIREEKKKGQKPSAKNGNKKGQRKSIAAHTASEASLLNSTNPADESTLEGAQGEDMDAEFILNVLENHTVTGSGGLAKLAAFIINICEQPKIYRSKEIQGAAVIALMRYMLVSSKFCSKHIRLVFTILEKTEYPQVKDNILVHLSDLLTRFPNVIEPWTPRIFQCLKDPLQSTRRFTFFTLSSLILRDMIRAHSHIPEMASSLADEDEEMRAMCKTFFVKLSHKENNLYNALPDIFTHLMSLESMGDEGVQSTMRFLFDLIDNKHLENLVDRFCSKFQMTEDIRHQRNIAYCLTLIKYNEKALKKLIDNFLNYKHLLHDAEIYASFKNITQNCNKQQVGKADLKAVVTELENSIKSVFELNENGLMPPPAPPKSARKPKSSKKKVVRKRKTKDSDDDSDDDGHEISRRNNRKRKNKTVIDDSDSD